MNKNNKIGVVIADDGEYDTLGQTLKEYSPKTINVLKRDGLTFNIDGVEIICICSGMGKVNAATVATYLVDNGCNIILNYGLSGGLKGVRLNDIVFPEKFIEHDFDLTGIGYKPCEKPHQKYIYDASPLREIFIKAYPGAKGGTAACGDSFICNEEDRLRLINMFNATTCDMETAAVASVCEMAGVDYIALRRVSDSAGEDAYSTYSDMNNNDGATLTELFLRGLEYFCEEIGKS